MLISNINYKTILEKMAKVCKTIEYIQIFKNKTVLYSEYTLLHTHVKWNSLIYIKYAILEEYI